MSAILDGNGPQVAQPSFGVCSDGVGLFYPDQVNVLFGDPESGKTMVALAAAVAALNADYRVAVIDLDHNGPGAIVERMIDLGASEGLLRNLNSFRYAEPDDGEGVLDVVADLQAWRPGFVIVDSIGELVPAFGGSSNSPDDYTRVHRQVLVPLAKVGACVVAIDHLAKSSESRAMGSTGTGAKKRAIGGTMLRVSVADAFTPGRGGRATLTIAKDRAGGLRQHRPTGDREPVAATFVMTADYDHPWELRAPVGGERNPAEAVPEADMQAIATLDPPPASVRDARQRLKWSNARAVNAMRDWRSALPGNTPVTPVTPEGEGMSERYRVTDSRGAVTSNTRIAADSGASDDSEVQRVTQDSSMCQACGTPMSAPAIARGESRHPTCKPAVVS